MDWDSLVARAANSAERNRGERGKRGVEEEDECESFTCWSLAVIWMSRQRKPFSEQPRESFCTVLIFEGVDISNFMIEWYESNPTYIQGNPIGLLKKKKPMPRPNTSKRGSTRDNGAQSQSHTSARSGSAFHPTLRSSSRSTSRRPPVVAGDELFLSFLPCGLLLYFFPFISSCTCSIAAAHGCYHDSKREREKKKRLRPWNKRLNLVRDRGVKQALMEPWRGELSS